MSPMRSTSGGRALRVQPARDSTYAESRLEAATSTAHCLPVIRGGVVSTTVSTVDPEADAADRATEAARARRVNGTSAAPAATPMTAPPRNVKAVLIAPAPRPRSWC